MLHTSQMAFSEGEIRTTDEAREKLRSVGEILTIDIPEATDARAVVEWKVDKFFGCRFVNPISQAAVSGCLLKADPQSAPADKCSMGDALRWIIFLTMVSWTPVVAVGLTFAH